VNKLASIRGSLRLVCRVPECFVLRIILFQAPFSGIDNSGIMQNDFFCIIHSNVLLRRLSGNRWYNESQRNMRRPLYFGILSQYIYISGSVYTG
jgi:hypothetical protein